MLNLKGGEWAGCLGLKNFMNAGVPIWEKAALTLEEAAAYSNIGINKLREITKKKNCDFTFYVGTKCLIKRRKFDKFIDQLEVV